MTSPVFLRAVSSARTELRAIVLLFWINIPSFNENKNRKKKLKVITKIPKLPSNLDKKKIEKWISQRVHLSLKNTRQKRFYGLLIHNSKDLLSPKGKVLFKNMVEIKKKGLAKKIGVSVYKVKDLKKILKFIILICTELILIL